MKTAFITGITGQDGSYLTELLLSKGYAVHGLVRRASAYNRTRIDHLRTKGGNAKHDLTLHYGELNDLTSFHRLLHKIKPDEVYHLGGQSHVGLSFEIPEITCLENGMATLHLLESLRELVSPPRLFLASSSETFGSPEKHPQNELTPLSPVNPYGCAKTLATNLARVYRDSHDLFVSIGIMYNHESPRRGENFVTKKIASGAARIARGAPEILQLGNLSSSRDWGYAKEYVEAMWQMLQAPTPGDFVLATGETCRVREFCKAAFDALDIPIQFEGSGLNEIAVRLDNRAKVIEVNPHFFRPVDAHNLVGDPTKARNILGWMARTKGPDLARLMAQADFEEA